MAGANDCSDDGSCLIEIIRLGNAVKVSAVDPRSGVEVSIVGPSGASQEWLERAAARKLAYRLRRRLR